MIEEEIEKRNMKTKKKKKIPERRWHENSLQRYYLFWHCGYIERLFGSSRTCKCVSLSTHKDQAILTHLTVVTVLRMNT